jgi:hypothetical protein
VYIVDEKDDKMKPDMLLKVDRKGGGIDGNIPAYVTEFFNRYSKLRNAHEYSKKAVAFLGNYCHSMFPRQGQNSNN